MKPLVELQQSILCYILSHIVIYFVLQNHYKIDNKGWFYRAISSQGGEEKEVRKILCCLKSFIVLLYSYIIPFFRYSTLFIYLLTTKLIFSRKLIPSVILLIKAKIIQSLTLYEIFNVCTRAFRKRILPQSDRACFSTIVFNLWNIIVT